MDKIIAALKFPVQKKLITGIPCVLKKRLLTMQFFQVCTYLTSKSWETRIAAGQAVEAIARNVKKWQPAGISSGSSRQPSPGGVAGPAAETEPTATSKEPSPTSDKDADLLTFETFDLNQVISVVYIMKCCIAENFCWTNISPSPATIAIFGGIPFANAVWVAISYNH